MFDSSNFVSDEARERERRDRMDRQNPPEVAHGQSSSDFDNLDLDSLFGDSNNSSIGGDPFGSFGSSGGSSQNGFQDNGFGSSFEGGFNSGFNTNNQQQSQKKPTEDIVFDVVKKGGGGLFAFTKEFVNSFKGLDAVFWSNFGNMLFKVSGVLTLLLFLAVLLGVDFLGYMVGSGLATAIGVLALSFNNEKARLLRQENLANEMSISNQGFFDINAVGGSEDTESFEGGDSFFTETDSSSNSISFEEDSDTDYNFDFEDDEEEYYEDEFMFESVVEEEPDTETVLSEVDIIPSGMYTRSFLYENYLKSLTKMTPEYSNIIELTEEDEEWDNYSSLIREAQEQMGLDSSDEYTDDLSEILAVEKRLLTIKIEATRPKKLSNAKLAEFDKELTSIVSVERGEIISGRYTKTIISGRSLYITIFLGTNATVSVKDALVKEKDFFLDTNVKIPVALGFDHLGNTVKADLYDLESVLTIGEPRSGKSFTIKTMMSQVIQFTSPKDVVFYFGDVKGSSSDWKEFRMPHVKRFEKTPTGILNMLTYITDVEKKKREDIFEKADVLNYKAYKKKYPDAELPIIYVVIDEMTTLSQKLNTNDAKLYKSRLVDIVTSLPSFGVKLWGIAHVVKNEVIPKTVSDSIGCRISVFGDESQIESVTHAKPKQFPFKLTNKGDCAVKMPLVKQEVFFMHSFIISKDDDGYSRVLDYQKKLWSKLEPESVKTSYSYYLNQKSQQDNKLNSLFDTDVKFDEDGMF